jgi:hypothetical protein
MLKLSTDSFVLTNAREIFLHRLIDLVDPLKPQRIFLDSLDALETMLEKNDFMEILSAAYVRALENIEKDTEYTYFSQGIIIRMQRYMSTEFVSKFVKRLEDLMESEKEEEWTKNHARELAEYIAREFPDYLK